MRVGLACCPQGNHIYTSGAIGTNAAVIKGALRANAPDKLTVILPQSLKRQPAESQDLLEQVRNLMQAIRFPWAVKKAHPLKAHPTEAPTTEGSPTEEGTSGLIPLQLAHFRSRTWWSCRKTTSCPSSRPAGRFSLPENAQQRWDAPTQGPGLNVPRNRIHRHDKQICVSPTLRPE